MIGPMTTEWTLKRFPSFPGLFAFAAVATSDAKVGEPARRVWNVTRPPTVAREYALALLCVAIVAMIRALLHPILTNASPLLIFVLPTVVMVMRNAPLPALCAAIASLAVAVRFFIEPSDPTWWSDPAQQARLAIFVTEIVIIVSFGWILQRGRQRELEVALQAERLRVVHVTMRTVQHVVNNSLNQLQALRMGAEGHVPEESLATFDATIRDTFSKLTALGNVRSYAEKPMALGVGLDDSVT
jgi:K+-sensing histidine kinase KdpD